MPYLFESERLGFRRLTQEGYPLVCSFLQDAKVMYAWEHPSAMRNATSGWNVRSNGMKRTVSASGR